MEEAFPALCQLTYTQLSQMKVAVTWPSTQGVFNPLEDNTGAVEIWLFLVGATQALLGRQLHCQYLLDNVLGIILDIQHCSINFSH